MKKTKIYEGKAKTIFKCEKPNVLIQHFEYERTISS